MQFIITRFKLGLNLVPKQLDQLWSDFVEKSIFEGDQIKFFIWLHKSTSNSIVNTNPYQLILDKQCMAYLFDEILCNPEKIDYGTMTKQAYKCFEIYFRYINAQAGKILLHDEQFKVSDSNLSGLNCLWAILLKSEN